jgi:uncharacterized protein
MHSVPPFPLMSKLYWDCRNIAIYDRIYGRLNSRICRWQTRGRTFYSRKQIMDVTLFLNHRCNLACSYCYNGKKFDRAMPVEFIKKAVDLAFSQGDEPQITFFGGEPILEFDRIKSAVSYAHQLQSNTGITPLFSVVTNGTLLDKGTVAYIAQQNFHLVISIDGTKKSHDRTRPFADGCSSYDSVVRNLVHATSVMPDVETISIIDPSNQDELPKSFLALLELNVRNMNFSFNYDALWNTQRLERLERSLDELVIQYVAKYREGLDFSFHLFDSKIVTHLKDGYSCNERCRFGDGELCVSPRGILYPCERLVGEDGNHHLAIGHIDTGVEYEKVFEMSKMRTLPSPDCRDCALNKRCMFWCGCVNVATTGRIGETSGLVCKTEQMVIRAADRAATQLYIEKNPTFMRKFYCV